MATEQELTRLLEQRARAEGFDVVAVAAAGRLERDGTALAAWLGAGRHAEMKWMARSPSARADPREILPGCRAVVSLALNYRPPDESPAEGNAARVALYAQGRDYHKLLRKKLRRLAAWLEEASGAVAKTFVDTGPVLERAWAEQAGLGWIGKNANLITREMGSWFLLGEILTTAALVPAPGPHADFCGSCTTCLEACPTGAILAPGVVDSRRCISYWTIEHRGPVPEELRSGLGDWIFGCDVCQEVCPWNRRFSRPACSDPLERREDLSRLNPEQLLDMDEATFRGFYSGTALMRAKWEGMRRNACIVLGNRGRRDALPALRRALDDPDPVVREHAAWAIRVIAGAGGPLRIESSRLELSRRWPSVVEKQQHPRKRGRIRARYGVDGIDRTAFTNNLSLSGAFLRTNMVFRPGTTIQLELAFSDENVQLWAQVVWSKKVPPQLAQTLHCGMGVRFLNPGPEWQEAFERWQAGKPKA